MAVVKVAVSLESGSVRELDRWVRDGRYANRSRAVQAAVNALCVRRRRLALALETANLDPGAEQQLADEFVDETWPQY